MRRTDRLFEIIQILRDGKLHRAQDIAARLEVSTRTIYRDMDTLVASGVPVEGERGVGYMVREAITLPPLNLTEIELESLHLALATLGASGLDDISEAARSLSAKIDAVLPEESGPAPAPFGFATDGFAEAARGFVHMPAIRAAIRAHQRLRLEAEGQSHDVRPLHLDYWGRVWSCICYSDKAAVFLTLRVDRITKLMLLPGLFVDEPGKTMADYRRLHNSPQR